MPLTKGWKKNGKRDESPEPGCSKKDKYTSDEDDQPSARKGQSSKMSKQGKMSKKSPSIMNKSSGPQSSHNKPAELFRKDLISAMKLADTEILFDNEYLVISDPWRQEWEKGVQVPVNEEEIPPCNIREVRKKTKHGDFKIASRKLLHEKSDETYQPTIHELTGMQEMSEQIVRYDLDDQDVIWLEMVNEDREEMGLQVINEWNMERMIEELETQCYIKTNALKKTEEGLGIEYDEDVACDVCHLLESEDTNEMVFCDGCDICVHQACYGIQTIPEGSWLCRICALGVKPMCLLCPKRGGAMKSTKSGRKWAHVSCALWIPEVSFGFPEKMEPITKISNIPPSRWALVCSLCKERVGACIQCAVKQCKTAFHVTCGFSHNLDMKTIVDDDCDDADGIHLKAYCLKHTKNRNASDCESPKKEEDLADMENEMEATKKRQEKLKQIEEDFFNLIDVKEIAEKFFIPEEAVDIVTEYWKLKRRVNNNKPLITPKMEEEDRMQKQQKDSLSARMKMFVHLRQDLERARNLCYMIGKREKTKRQFLKLKEKVFHCQLQVLTDPDLSAREAEQVRCLYHFDSLYSHYGALSAQGSKQPRENLFTLQNLKTPKDMAKSRKKSGQSMSALMQSNLGKESKAKSSALNSDLESNQTIAKKTSLRHRKNLFSVGILSDSTEESSEDEAHDLKPPDPQLPLMSRLGKVPLQEVESGSEEDGTLVVKTVPMPKKSFVPASDLGKKLSLFLQSKTKMQQKQEDRSNLERLEQVLYVDVGHHDSDAFTSPTEFSPSVDQPRNLFDHFGMKDKSFLSFSDTPQPDKSSSHKHFRKSKKRKHNHSAPKITKLRLVMSPSDQSIKSHGSTPDTEQPADLTSKSQVSYLVAPISKKRGRKSKSAKAAMLAAAKVEESLKLSPTPRIEADSVYPTLDDNVYVPTGKILVTERTIVLNSPKHEDNSRLKSKLRLKKQGDSPVKGLASYMVVQDDRDMEPQEIRSMDKQKPSVKEEKNIFDRVMDSTPLRMDDPKIKCEPEHRSKLTRRKPDEIKGCKDDTLKLEHHIKHKLPQEENLAFTGLKLEPEFSEDARSELSNFIVNVSQDKEPKDKVKSEPVQSSRHPKVRSSDSEKIVDATVTSKNMLKSSEKDKMNPETSPLSPSTRSRLKRASFSAQKTRKKKNWGETEQESMSICDDSSTKDVASSGMKLKSFELNHDLERAEMLDENQRPRLVTSKVLTQSPHSRKSLTSVKVKEEEDDDPVDEFAKQPSFRRSVTEATADAVRGGNGRGVKLAKLPNKTHLNALLVSSKLTVKVSKLAGDELKKRLKLRGRFGRVNGVKRGNDQTTLDSFVKRTGLCDNVFGKIDNAKQNNCSKNLCLPTVTSDLSPLRLNQSQSQNISPEQATGKSPHLSNGLFGSQSSPRSSLSHLSAYRDVDQNRSPNAKTTVFGDVHKLTRQLSFEDIRGNVTLEDRTSLAEVVKTPSKCDRSVLLEDKLDGHRSYRSHSPPSSEGSGTSQPDSVTPSRRITRSCAAEDNPSPNTRLRRKDSLLKAPLFKL